MPIKFYTDSHIPNSAIEQLRQQGVDILRCQDVGMIDAKDSEHLELAVSQYRSIVTNDADFQALHYEWAHQEKTHTGIFLITHNKEDIGMIVTTLAFWHEAILHGAADLEKDVYNQINYLPERKRR